MAPAVGPCVGDSVLFVVDNYTNNLQWFDGTSNDSVYVKATSDVVVEYLFANGECSVASEPIAYAFGVLPAKPTITLDGPTTFCEGDSVGVQHAISVDFLWSTGNTLDELLYFTGSATVSVEAISPKGCRISSDTVTLLSSPKPIQPSIIKIEGVAMDSLQSTVVGFSYQWFFESQPLSFNQQTIPLENAGFYRVNVSSADGCISNISEGFTNVGVAEILKNSITVYSETNRWLVTTTEQVEKAELYDASGRRLLTFDAAQEFAIDNKGDNQLLLLKLYSRGRYVTVKLK
jgi:hypothetical protein